MTAPEPLIDLRAVAAIARDADLPDVAAEADALAGRLDAGRFFVACVGQFKRGKSTLLNAIVGDRVLPAGVTPVTSAVTVLRHGAERRATVHYLGGASEAIAVEDVAQYVTEAHNHENVRGVAAVELFLPAPLLANGMCLVDTPGIGSAFAGNTEATRAFVPHIDAALVVLGADPPVSGDELALVADVLAQVPDAIFVLNKADRLPAADLREARAFTERVIAERVHRPIAPMLEVSAAERVEGSQPTRDWRRLERALEAMAGRASEILCAARDRWTARLVRRIDEDLDERRAALRRPIADSEARIETLGRSVAEAERMLRELGILLAAEQRPLLRAFQERQAAFLEYAIAAARERLRARIDRDASGRFGARARAFAHALALARDGVQRWLDQIEPEADELYRRATQRFTMLADGFLDRLAASNDPAFARLPRRLDVESGLREERRYYGIALMHLTAPGLINRAGDLLLPRAARLARIDRAAGAYLERLLRSNTTRVVFDLEQRVEASRRALEAELRLLLQQITSTATRALDRARVRLQEGETAVARELAAIEALERRLHPGR